MIHKIMMFMKNGSKFCYERAWMIDLINLQVIMIKYNNEIMFPSLIFNMTCKLEFFAYNVLAYVLCLLTEL
jgi:hypothetical protein